jgi:hypothetical protein
MRFAVRLALAGALLTQLAAPALAQAPPPKIGPFVVDLHGLFVKFPNTQALADSRGLVDTTQLPGAGFGGAVGLHLYLLKWKQVTFGIGGEVVGLRAHKVPAADALIPGLPAVTEKFLTASPQLSFNFGGMNGWSYISGGIGLSQWSVIADGAESQDADIARLRTFNYGGGARWFVKKHLAFSFDVRVYSIDAGTPASGFSASPRSSLTVIGAGVSVK